jgi:uncharacterized protein YbjQ (UPF0145 family)
MTTADDPMHALDLKAEVRRAMASLETAAPYGGSTTSDLSIDEELNLHSIGWEPVELVSGLSVVSVPWGAWNWGQGEISAASEAHEQAFRYAIARLHNDAAAAGGHGVVGVHIARSVHPRHIELALLGTAVRPIGASVVTEHDVFVSDLSARDFTLLMVSGGSRSVSPTAPASCTPPDGRSARSCNNGPRTLNSRTSPRPCTRLGRAPWNECRPWPSHLRAPASWTSP